MPTPQSQKTELIDVSPLGNAIADTKTKTLVSTSNMKVLRLVLPAGKQIAKHVAPGEITVQCIEGEIDFFVRGEAKRLAAGHMLHCAGGEPHALTANIDSSVLVTIALH